MFLWKITDTEGTEYFAVATDMAELAGILKYNESMLRFRGVSKAEVIGYSNHLLTGGPVGTSRSDQSDRHIQLTDMEVVTTVDSESITVGEWMRRRAEDRAAEHAALENASREIAEAAARAGEEERRREAQFRPELT